jgi:DNA-binding transcriptional LysR family regulator
MQRQPPRDDLAWDDVRLFLALSRARTVREAASRLRVDASTVSRRLAVLEAALASTLFDRGRDGITATKAAEDLLPVAEESEEVMNRFVHAADGLERAVAGVVRITCPQDVAEVIVAPLLQGLLARHPDLRIELAPGEAVLDLTRREADIALRTVRPTRGDLVVTRLATVRWIAVATPALAGRLGALRAWSDAPWIGWGERLSNIAPARWLAAHVTAVPVVRSDSLALQLALAVQGVGAVLAPEPSARHYGLVPLRMAKPLRADAASWPSDDLHLVTHRALRQVPRVRVVWDLLVERAADRR